MGIQVNCPTCGRAYNLRDNQAGLKVSCRNCAEQFTVPGNPLLTTNAPSQNLGAGANRAEQSGSGASGQEPKGRPIWPYILAGVGGFLLLTCVGVCTGVYFLSKKAQEVIGDPKDLNAAIARLNSGDRVKETAIWLQNQDVNQDQQADVARALAAHSREKEPFSKEDVFKALEKWATREQVPMLMETVQKEHFGTREAALDALIRLRDPRSAGVLIASFNEGGRKQRIEEALTAMTADNPRETTDALLKTIKDGGDLGKAAAEYLARQPIDPKRQPEIARELAKTLTDGNHPEIKDPLTKALLKWVTPEQVSVLIDLTRPTERSATHDAALDALIRLKDPRSVTALLENLTPDRRPKILVALREIGKAGEDQFLQAMNSPVANTRADVQTLLTEVCKTAPDALLTQTVADLSVTPRLPAACEWLVSQAALADTSPKRAVVARALEARLKSESDKRNQEHCYTALAVWFDKDSVPILLDGLKLGGKPTDKLVEALARTQDARAAIALAGRLGQGKASDRQVLVASLKKMSPQIAEPPILDLLQASPTNKNLVLDACEVLTDLGTSKATPVLEAVGKKNKDAQVQLGIKTASEAIKKRS
jgi:HEAT repeat protein